MTRESIHASAPGKLILAGEYAVLEGAPAIVMAVDRRARVTGRPRAADFSVTAPQLAIERELLRLDDRTRVRPGDAGRGRELSGKLAVVARLLEAAAAHASRAGSALRPADLQIDTSDFYRHGDKLGFGSSAAVSVALWGALLSWSGLEPTRVPASEGGWIEQVIAAHRAAQGGTGSGVDVAASAVGGLSCFRIGSPPKRLDALDRLAIQVVWTGRSTSTAGFVRAVQRAAAAGGPARHALREMADLAERIAELAVGDDTAEAGGRDELLLEALGGYGEAMGALGQAAGVPIVSEEHRALGKVVRDAGGRYKPSGAGGGDVGVAVSPLGSAPAVASALRDCGAHVVDVTLESRGLVVGSA